MSQIKMSLVVGLAILLSAPIAMACFRDTECPGAEICSNGECKTSDNLNSCESDEECARDEVCSDNFCKIDNVICRDDIGNYCHLENIHTLSCICMSGEGMDTGFDGEEIPEATDAELFAECVSNLDTFCDDEIPDLDEVCTPENLSNCQSVLEKIEILEENCADIWDDEDGTSGETEEETESNADTDDEGNEEDNANEDSSTNNTLKKLKGKLSQRQEIDSDIWMIAECCEEFADEAMADEWSEFLQCILGLSNTDCEGAMACDIGLDDNSTDETNADDDEGNDGSQTDDANDDGQANDADAGTNTNAEDDTNDSGCSFLSVNSKHNLSILNILRTVSF